MTRRMLLISLLMGVALPGTSQVGEANKGPALWVMLSEVQPGAIASEQYCMLVFADRRFHAEKASRHAGKDRERTVYEGDLSDSDWNALDRILESDQFRGLNVPPGYVPLTVQNAHPYTINVRREKGFQSMEFIDDNSRKPYDHQLKPLLQWWKSVRGRRMGKSEAPSDKRCALDSTHGVFTY